MTKEWNLRLAVLISLIAAATLLTQPPESKVGSWDKGDKLPKAAQFDKEWKP